MSQLGVFGVSDSRNATVPDDAKIQPPDAFVLYINDFLLESNGAPSNGITADAAGGDPRMTFISQILVSNSALAVGLITGNPPEISMQGNAFTQVAVDGMLLELVSANNHGDINNGTLNISGGTSSPPSAAGLVNKGILVGQGWTITTN